MPLASYILQQYGCGYGLSNYSVWPYSQRSDFGKEVIGLAFITETMYIYHLASRLHYFLSPSPSLYANGKGIFFITHGSYLFRRGDFLISTPPCLIYLTTTYTNSYLAELVQCRALVNFKLSELSPIGPCGLYIIREA